MQRTDLTAPPRQSYCIIILLYVFFHSSNQQSLPAVLQAKADIMLPHFPLCFSIPRRHP